MHTIYTQTDHIDGWADKLVENGQADRQMVLEIDGQADRQMECCR